MGDMMRRAVFRVVVASLVWWATAARIRAEELSMVWDLDLRKVMPESEGKSADLPVLSLRFSPDGQRIAAVVHPGTATGSADSGSRLLVVPTQNPEAVVRTFPIQLGTSDGPFNHGWLTLVWTASGTEIVADGKALNVRDGKASEIVNDRMVSFAESIRRSIGCLVLDAAGQPTRPLRIPKSWDILDISADRRLLCVRDTSNVMIVDPITEKVIQIWPVGLLSGGLWFGDSDKVVCLARSVESSQKVPASCWDVGTGKKIAEYPTINGGLPMAVSARASRLVGSDYRYSFYPFSDNLFTAMLRRRVVLDLRTGRELAAWRPQKQSYLAPGLVDPPRIQEPFLFAISPDGQVIAEGGNGVLRLYRVGPSESDKERPDHAVKGDLPSPTKFRR